MKDLFPQLQGAVSADSNQRAAAPHRGRVCAPVSGLTVQLQLQSAPVGWAGVTCGLYCRLIPLPALGLRACVPENPTCVQRLLLFFPSETCVCLWGCGGGGPTNSNRGKSSKIFPTPPQDLFKKKLHCKKSQTFDAILRMVKKKKKRLNLCQCFYLFGKDNVIV